jgi:hypothetical protein
MENPAAGVSGLLGIIQAFRRTPDKGYFQLSDEDLIDKRLALPDKNVHGIRIVDAVSGLDDIVSEELGIVVRTERDDPSLGIVCIRILE